VSPSSFLLLLLTTLSACSVVFTVTMGGLSIANFTGEFGSFAYYPQPVVLHLQPDSGNATGGTAVIVEGSLLSSALYFLLLFSVERIQQKVFDR
jgi:hypothetical protein